MQGEKNGCITSDQAFLRTVSGTEEVSTASSPARENPCMDCVEGKEFL